MAEQSSAMGSQVFGQALMDSCHIYGRNQSGCEKAKSVGFLPFILLVLLTIYISVALMKITICFKQLEASNIMS